MRPVRLVTRLRLCTTEHTAPAYDTGTTEHAAPAYDTGTTEHTAAAAGSDMADDAARLNETGAELGNGTPPSPLRRPGLASPQGSQAQSV
jgi:hypothetical protein